MGPKARYLGPEVPAEDLIWQDPIPAVDHPLIDAKDIADLKAKVLASGLSVAELVPPPGPQPPPSVAPTSAAGQRRPYSPGAAEGLAGQPAGAIGQSAGRIRIHQKSFNSAQTGGKKVSMADLIVLAGCAAVEAAAKAAGHGIEVPFTPGRTDATQEQTHVKSFAVMEPEADGFRNYQKKAYTISAEEMLVDKAQLLTLSAPEMTVLVGGLRVLGANVGNHSMGCSLSGPESSPTTSLSTWSTWPPSGSLPLLPGTPTKGAIVKPVISDGPGPA